ncbi:MAG: histidine--tRNA ligase [Candidatus Parcubacteria bacterium]|nr:MAG: histidine--tRNA ligase [Candidatus Parcubacteria bacterium]
MCYTKKQCGENGSSNARSSQPLSVAPYRGVRDFYPEDMRVFRAIEARVRSWIERWGFEEYGASLLEPAELYEAKAAENEEIAREQTYTFTDRGGRRVTLRPEMTPTLARLAAARAKSLRFPLRWYSFPNVFRYERPQEGRLREHWQWNCDILGEPGVSADIEIITLASSILTDAFGAPRESFEVRVSHRGILTALEGEYLSEPLTNPTRLWAWIDRKEKMDAAEFTRGLRDILPFDDAKVVEAFLEAGSLDEALSLFPRLASVRAVERLREAQEGLTLLGVPWRFDASLVRGFNYYTGIVFEVFATTSGLRRSIFGGGRYDGLTTLFGAPPIPAVGFGLGDVTLAAFLEALGLLPQSAFSLDLLVVPLGACQLPLAQKHALSARKAGARAVALLAPASPKEGVEEALRAGARWVVFVGDHEEAQRIVTLKHLPSRTQREAPEEGWEHLLARDSL